MIRKTKTIKIKKLNPAEYYSLTDLARMNAFPWIGSDDVRPYRKLVLLDRAKSNYLKGLLTGKGKKKRYMFLGENVISFISIVRQGSVNL